jgi:UTP-glucose-1-phosphate uridylyltransferase
MDIDIAVVPVAGLGTRLLPDLTKRPDAKIRRSAA